MAGLRALTTSWSIGDGITRIHGQLEHILIFPREAANGGPCPGDCASVSRFG
jgi:hypothetical protein